MADVAEVNPVTEVIERRAGLVARSPGPAHGRAWSSLVGLLALLGALALREMRRTGVLAGLLYL